ncbi:MAG: Ig-like domain-containing protein [candidate division Zixibacteria bacterium]|jgi:hypothetical protein|nr:Ig-like domain-containing protein [candidate division Zixibacteria bacterium]
MTKKVLIYVAIWSLMIVNCSKKTITNNYYTSPDKGAIVGLVHPSDSEAKVTAYLGVKIASTYIDTTGYFKLTDLPIGTYSLLVEAEGYFDYQSKPYISVTGGATVSVDTIFLTSIHDLVLSVSPPNGAEGVRPNDPIRIIFRRDMDRKSVEDAFHVQPLVEGDFFWYSYERKGIYGSTLLEFIPWNLFATNTRYQVTIDTTASDVEGIRLSKPYQFSFITEPIRILSTKPAHKETWVSQNAHVSIIFNTDMDVESVILAFKMVDSKLKDVVGKFIWYTQQYIEFYPDFMLATNEKYTVTIDTNAKDMYGGTLDNPYNFWFKTRPY